MIQRTQHSNRFMLGMAILAVGGGATIGGVLQRGRPAPTATKSPDAGIEFRLRDGDRRKASNERIKPSPATMLSDADADAILNRVPALPNDGSDQFPFRAPENSLPPPRAGVTVPATFPPAPAGPKPAVDNGPLAIRSITPNGEVGSIDRVTVNFNQPMVPLSSVDSLAEQVPARISPATDGKWRWLGTQTLVFEFGSGQRLRNATDYVVTVPAGTRSISREYSRQSSYRAHLHPVVTSRCKRSARWWTSTRPNDVHYLEPGNQPSGGPSCCSRNRRWSPSGHPGC